jgi:hypothetical protein
MNKLMSKWFSKWAKKSHIAHQSLLVEFEAKKIELAVKDGEFIEVEGKNER